MGIKCITSDGKKITLLPTRDNENKRIDALTADDINVGPITYSGSFEIDQDKFNEYLRLHWLREKARQEMRDIYLNEVINDNFSRKQQAFHKLGKRRNKL